MPAPDLTKPPFSADAWIAAALRGEQEAAGDLSESAGEQIIQSAIYHGVAPLLHHFLSHGDTWAEYPKHFRESATLPARQSAAWDLLREWDLGQVLDQLAVAGIQYLLIKGAGLAYTFYEHSYLRERCDADILFPDQSTFDRAWELLDTMGYSRRNTLSGEFVGYQHCCHRLIGHGVHQVLDCHIKINDYLFYADAFDFTELYELSVPVPQLAESARTLGPVHALLMACMHRVATIPLGNADRLIWLFDMHLLGQSFSSEQWAQFLALARDRKLCGSCVHSLDTAQLFFPVAVPAKVMAELEQAAEKESFKPGHEMKRWQYYFFAFKSVPGLRKKARLIREHFVPSADYLMEKYQTTNRFTLPFLYVHRVFAGLKRYF